ncbi:hypothetical protein [Salinarimonas ramus]|uniref:Uncharacterized protein n=1 Tax=Salinarimonas ramus TaxID=690164 RepID=A0A917V4V8_9HYPH|nr:hypothetical protein [Salinarimonas ramus]GGK36997.1 hypothetical protein GCM10011322_25020 [Salinarimonas ramus]
MTGGADACPLAALCAEAGDLIRRRLAAEERGLRGESPRERIAAQATVDEITATLENIAHRASDYRPASRDGALLAIGLALAEAEIVAFGDEGRQGPALRRLTRLLFALRGYVERDGGPRSAAADAVASYWMPDAMDPHRALAG